MGSRVVVSNCNIMRNMPSGSLENPNKNACATRNIPYMQKTVLRLRGSEETSPSHAQHDVAVDAHQMLRLPGGMGSSFLEPFPTEDRRLGLLRILAKYRRITFQAPRRDEKCLV